MRQAGSSRAQLQRRKRLLVAPRFLRQLPSPSRSLERSTHGNHTGTVLIHLLAAAVTKEITSNPSLANAQPTIESVYIRCSSPFPQVESFVTICTDRYHLNLDAVDGGMKEGLASYIDSKKATKSIEAILVGTRRGDPHGGQSVIPTHFGNNRNQIFAY